MTSFFSHPPGEAKTNIILKGSSVHDHRNTAIMVLATIGNPFNIPNRNNRFTSRWRWMGWPFSELRIMHQRGRSASDVALVRLLITTGLTLAVGRYDAGTAEPLVTAADA